jgi:1-acyl-sn-glycerol-3-phosphate acyltransferase
MRLGIRSIHVAGIPERLRGDSPLLLAANHVSWWDGFILRAVQQNVRPGRPLHIVMLERELARHPFLKRLGGLGLEPGSPASLRALLRDLREERERDPGFSVLFFPQGRIWPSYRRPLGFQGGIRLVAAALGPATVLPVGLHLEAGKEMAPAAFVSLGAPLEAVGGDLDPEALEGSVEEELDRIHRFLAEFGEDVTESWPGAGEGLPRAPNGVPGER